MPGAPWPSPAAPLGADITLCHIAAGCYTWTDVLDHQVDLLAGYGSTYEASV
jgi:hypothetical protein